MKLPHQVARISKKLVTENRIPISLSTYKGKINTVNQMRSGLYLSFTKLILLWTRESIRRVVHLTPYVKHKGQPGCDLPVEV
jgi:hypothetical protein